MEHDSVIGRLEFVCETQCTLSASLLVVVQEAFQRVVLAFEELSALGKDWCDGEVAYKQKQCPREDRTWPRQKRDADDKVSPKHISADVL
eukprot:5313598-Amphidinium_carterae.1